MISASTNICAAWRWRAVTFRLFSTPARRTPAERGAVVLEFGDHQSSATKPFVERSPARCARPGRARWPTEPSTRVTTFNHPLRHPMPDGAARRRLPRASLLDAAGLPMSPVMADLVRLRDHCGGSFHGCPDRAAVDAHLRRRVDFGPAASVPAGRPAAMSVRNSSNQWTANGSRRRHRGRHFGETPRRFGSGAASIRSVITSGGASGGSDGTASVPAGLLSRDDGWAHNFPTGSRASQGRISSHAFDWRRERRQALPWAGPASRRSKASTCLPRPRLAECIW